MDSAPLRRKVYYAYIQMKRRKVYRAYIQMIGTIVQYLQEMKTMYLSILLTASLLPAIIREFDDIVRVACFLS